MKSIVHIYIKIVCIMCLMIFSASMRAQDIHFSNFYASPLNLNPALSGLFRGNIRATALYRDQYRTVSRPYQTLALGVDCLYKRRRNKHLMFGYGLQINYDVAGDSRFSSTQLIVPLAIHFPINRDKVILSFGISPALHFYSFSQSGMQLPNQFIDDRYVAGQSIDDNFSQLSTRLFDLAAGVNLKFFPKSTQSYSIGLAIHNINEPQLSFFDKNSDNKIPNRFVAHFQLRQHVLPRIDFVPELRWQMQRTQQEWQFGVNAIQSIDNVMIPFLEYGLGFRARSYDALIARIGFTYHDFLTSLTYDVNMSKLREASNFHGAFEISVIYIYNRANYPRKTKSIKCPTHI